MNFRKFSICDNNPGVLFTPIQKTCMHTHIIYRKELLPWINLVEYSLLERRRDRKEGRKGRMESSTYFLTVWWKTKSVCCHSKSGWVECSLIHNKVQRHKCYFPHREKRYYISFYESISLEPRLHQHAEKQERWKEKYKETLTQIKCSKMPQCLNWLLVIGGGAVVLAILVITQLIFTKSFRNSFSRYFFFGQINAKYSIRT